MTRRAVLLGLLLTIALAIVIPYSDLQLKGTWIAACHLPVGAFFLFVVLTLLLNPLLKRLHGKLALRSGELVTVYAMTLVGSGLPSFGLSAYLIPTLAGCGYFATPENHWATWFYRYVPQWFVPFDLSRIPGSPASGLPTLYRWIPHRFHPAGPDILRQFYEGLPASRPIPWGPWVVPLFAWTLFALLFFTATYALSVILRRQWAEGERLTFPLVQLPLVMVEETAGGTMPFLKQPAVWVAFVIPQLVHLLNGIHTYFPAVPAIPLRFDLTHTLTGRPWNQLGILWVWIHFSVIGLTFLLPPDFSFSLWFCYLLFKLEGALIVSLGGQLKFMPNYPVPRYAGLQMLGAFLILAGYLCYAARPHLRGVWSTVRKLPGALDDSNEPLSYRTAVLGGLLALLGASVLLASAGLNFLVALASLLLAMMVILILTRMISEGGLLFVQAPFRPSDMYLTAVGSGALGARNLTVLAFYERIFAFDVRACLQPYLMDSFRLSDGPGVPRRKLTGALVLAVLASIVVSYGAILQTAYRHGAITQQGWFMIASPQQPFNQLASYLGQPTDPQPLDLLTVAIGAVVTLFLCVARNRFAGFPLHPMGFAMGPSWPLIQLWFSLFLGWLFKASILRWSGMKGYRSAYPFFLGLVLGEFTAAGFWVIVGMLAGTGVSYRFLLT